MARNVLIISHGHITFTEINDLIIHDFCIYVQNIYTYIYGVYGGVVTQLDVFIVIQIFDMYHKFLHGFRSIVGSLHGCKGQS